MSVAQVCGYVLVTFLGLLGFTVLLWIWQEKIDLTDLVNEANGQASMSRFQLLIFTFVIAVSLFEVVENRTTTFPEIPSGILTLLGISASTYAVSKGISYSQPDVLVGTWKRKGEDSQNVADAQAAAEASQQHADVAKEHADTAKDQADTAKKQANTAKGHADDAQQAARQTADNADQVKQAAERAGKAGTE
jgi:gas vesicle protein